MKILMIAHLFPPRHCAGAEAYMLNLAKFLISQGHEVRVLLRQANWKDINEDYHYDGIDVFVSHKKYNSGEIGPVETHILWATHLIAHLENMKWTVEIGRMFKKKIFFISHNSWDYPCINQKYFKPQEKYPVGVIYNSEWMQKKLKYPQRSIVLHPPISEEKVDRNNQPINAKYITIINANERKGGSIFKKIVRAMPDHEFLFVLGAYDDQVTPDRPNAMCYAQTTDMLSIYRQTRLLLVPSAYESWSMCANEAMANGIPVISSKTPGLVENCSYAGIFVDSPRMQAWMKLREPPTNMEDQRAVNEWIKNEQIPAFDIMEPGKNILNNDDINMWVEEIKRFDDKEYYNCMSDKCRKRAAELDPRKELLAVEKFLNEN